jgi:DNA end-binding protein Ku
VPRPLWNGSISFGLVNVPVQLVGATRDQDLHFRQLHAEDNAPIKQVRVCSEDGKEVAYEDVGHGFDLDGERIVITDAELEAVAPSRTRTIDVESFVDLDDVPPILFDKPYWLVPTGAGEGGLRAYRLLVEVMQRSGQAAIGRFVLRTRERFGLLRARDGRLECTTLRFGDEVRGTDGIDGGAAKVGKEAVDTMVALVEELSVDWEPAQYEDCFRSRLEAVVQRKQAGETVRAPEQDPAPKAAPDLMEALRRSLEAARGGTSAPAVAAADGGATSGAGDLAELTKDELLERARKERIGGRSKMSKDELVEALSERVS